jgi:hypothetical protein
MNFFTVASALAPLAGLAAIIPATAYPLKWSRDFRHTFNGELDALIKPSPTDAIRKPCQDAESKADPVR